MVSQNDIEFMKTISPNGWPDLDDSTQYRCKEIIKQYVGDGRLRIKPESTGCFCVKLNGEYAGNIDFTKHNIQLNKTLCSSKTSRIINSNSSQPKSIFEMFAGSATVLNMQSGKTYNI